MNNKRLLISNKIYPYFSGLSADLVFWVAINTLFLSTVKHLSASSINSLVTISVIIAFIVQLFSIKIVKRIGNVVAVRLGVILMLMAAIFLTVSKSYSFLLFGQTLYEVSIVFINMSSVILIKNLKYQNRSNDYIKIQSKGSVVYSFVTMIISFISGFLFNVNQYLPMIICILICILNVILSFFIYEVDDVLEEKNNDNKFNFTEVLVFIFILYGLFYPILELGQSNSKLFLQYNMSEFLSLDKVAIYLSFFIAGSRIVRLVSDKFFIRIYSKLKNNIIYVLGGLLFSSFVFILTGNMVKTGMIGIFIMVIGFLIFLGIRDLFDNYMRTILFENCRQKFHSDAINYLALSRKIGKLLLSLIITIILLKHSMLYVMLFLLFESVIDIFIIKKVYNLVNN